MRRSTRLSLLIACAASAAVCILMLLQAVGALPPFGVSRGDATRGRAYSVGFDRSFLVQTLSGVAIPPPSHAGAPISFVGDRVDVAGIYYHRFDVVNLAPDGTPLPGVFGTQTELRIWPVWPGLFLLALLLLWQVLAARHRHAPRAGRFCTCGYDLRATPDRCPECGRVHEERDSAVDDVRERA